MRLVNVNKNDLQMTREEYRHSDSLKKALKQQEEAFDFMSTLAEVKEALQSAKKLNHTEKSN